jgi:hypothetical protein
VIPGIYVSQMTLPGLFDILNILLSCNWIFLVHAFGAFFGFFLLDTALS